MLILCYTVETPLAWLQSIGRSVPSSWSHVTHVLFGYVYSRVFFFLFLIFIFATKNKK